MEPFAHFNAETIDDAVLLLRRYGDRAHVIAGGTDLIGKMKDRILPTYPEALVNIKTIPSLGDIEIRNGMARIGPLCTLEEIAKSRIVEERWPALAQAAARAASPHLREMGTIGGNICQDIRCWYYRHPDNRFPCLRKGGGKCYAIDGDNRFHSLFGGSVEQGCYAVHPSDAAPALVALDARVKTTKREVPIEDFFRVSVQQTTILDADEIVTEIQLPLPTEGTKSAFGKFALRTSIDFPLVNCAAAVALSQGKAIAARICLNAVYVRPYRPVASEEAILGKPLTGENIERAADAAVSCAKPLGRNRYMVQIARTMVKRALLACR
jgi:xanthine dehydrogenase YagS FAD-binding subunit